MSATYNGLVFDTPLLAQWAAFFDLAGWNWSRGIEPVDDWKPDYRVKFTCDHSGCGGSHTILVSVLPITEITGMESHPALKHLWGVSKSGTTSTIAKEIVYPKYPLPPLPPKSIIADAGAVFGVTPEVTHWVMSHGSGGGEENVTQWVSNWDMLWRDAKSLVQTSYL